MAAYCVCGVPFEVIDAPDWTSRLCVNLISHRNSCFHARSCLQTSLSTTISPIVRSWVTLPLVDHALNLRTKGNQLGLLCGNKHCQMVMFCHLNFQLHILRGALMKNNPQAQRKDCDDYETEVQRDQSCRRAFAGTSSEICREFVGHSCIQ